ncbi:glutathione S-transferase family protein [Sulfitobacter dubius]|uniref:Glutathione S-transferase GstB n=1 Tax=Sulfitobacter dubius TaxID=218673 RepID=A0ABY3ZTW6_9RHOB|nr:glutathione S-transferase family protein [Sulfitobacter dubius]UOA17066.1 Glutathione S-transferase GstB [Sulfitobacter dubius]
MTDAQHTRVLYDHPMSANCQKIHMMLACLGLPYENIFVDVLNGATKENGFTQMNPMQQIPVLRDGADTISDSQAILVYLAAQYGPEWADNTPIGMAKIAEWLSFATKEVSNGPQMARLWHLTGEDSIDIDAATAAGLKVLTQLQSHLESKKWLCLDRPTIADIAVFPYIATARDGKLPLDDYPAVCAWLERIRALPGYRPLEGSAEMADKYQNSKEAYA